MAPQLAIKQDDAYMNIVITTGCPHSGWETSLPALRQLGLEETGNTFTKWCDELFQESNITNQLQLNQAIQPDSNQIKKAASLLLDKLSVPLLWADSRNLWLLDFWASTFPQANFLLFYNRSENALAYALQQKADPEQFIEAWQTTNQQLLRFQRRNRHRSLLLDAETAAQHPEALASACQHIGLTLQSATPSPSPTTTAPALERLLASQLLHEQLAVQNLQMELEASAQPLGETAAHNPPQPIEACHSYQQWQVQLEQLTQARDEQTKLAADHQAQLTQTRHSQEKLEATNKETAQENELLLLQLHQVQEELEAIFLQKQQLEQAQTEHKTKLKQLQQEVNEARQKTQIEEKRCKRLADEKQQLRKQIEQLTNEGATNKHIEEKRCKRLADEQQQLRTQIEQRTKEDAANKEAEQENELLLLQLHQVQEELEHYFLKYQEFEQQSENKQATEEPCPTKPQKANNSTGIFSKLFRPMSKTKKRVAKQVHLLKESSLFNNEWYLAEYPDVAQAGIDPIQHYLLYGASEGRNPSREFNTAYYLATNPDVATTEINPLIHYIQYGQDEGRQPSR